MMFVLAHPVFWIGLVALALVAVGYVKANLRICPPNEVLIFSGRTWTREDGTRVGYRVIRGGRALKIPIIESVSRLSLSTMPIDIKIDGVLTKGMIPVSIRSVANVKVASSEEAGLENAIERFLGKPQSEIAKVAREIIEGNLRGVLATMTPEEANDDRLGVANRVMEESREDLLRLGLVIDNLKIENLSDDRGYLEAIGRQKNAEVNRDAETAEADAEAVAAEAAARARERAEVADHEADEAIVEAEHDLRMKRAELEAESNREEAVARMAGEIAEAEQARKRDEARIEQKKRETEADVVVPARAEKEALELKAEGEAARVLENGTAKARAMHEMRQEWDDGKTRDLFLIQILPDIVEEFSETIRENLDIDRVSIVGNGGSDGNGIPDHVRGVAGSVAGLMEELKTATGLDIAEILSERGADDTGELIRKELE